MFGLGDSISKTGIIVTLLTGIFIGASMFSLYSELFRKSIPNDKKEKNKRKLENGIDRWKIMQVNNAPLELIRRFEKKGFVYVRNNLASVNSDLNEFVELMRCYNLDSLNGCEIPDECGCTFRHKYCRLFMIRKYSHSEDLQFYSPSCSGVIDMTPTNDDIKNDTDKNKFVNLFQNKFSDRVIDLVNYVDFIIDPQREDNYVVDVIFIADPYYKGFSHTRSNGYGKPLIENDNDDENIKNIRPIQVDKRMCSLNWHQDQFVETKSKKTYGYDCVALFVLDAKNVTPHKLMIGKMKNSIDMSNMTLEEIQEHIVPHSDIDIDNDSSNDIGYIIDQRRKIFHKHSDFEHENLESRRNAVAIRFKYLTEHTK